MTAARLTARAREREEVAAVFGGALAERPWVFGPPGYKGRRARFTHWYEGVPDYVSREYAGGPFEYRTAIVCEMFGERDAPPGWDRVASYTSSGEASCMWCDREGIGEGTGDRRPPSEGGATKRGDRVPKVHRCKLCGGDGYIYLGDGYSEVIFRRWADTGDVRLYVDNGPGDRFTAMCIEPGGRPWGGYEALAITDGGHWTITSGDPGRHLGKRVKIGDLPEAVRLTVERWRFDVGRVPARDSATYRAAFRGAL